MRPEHIEQAITRMADFALTHADDTDEEREEAGRLMKLGVGLNPDTQEAFEELTRDHLPFDLDAWYGRLLNNCTLFGLVVGLSASFHVLRA